MRLRKWISCVAHFGPVLYVVLGVVLAVATVMLDPVTQVLMSVVALAAIGGLVYTVYQHETWACRICDSKARRSCRQHVESHERALRIYHSRSSGYWALLPVVVATAVTYVFGLPSLVIGTGLLLSYGWCAVQLHAAGVHRRLTRHCPYCPYRGTRYSDAVSPGGPNSDTSRRA